MLKKYTWLLIFVFLTTMTYGQKSLLEREVTDDLFNKEKGPNLKKYDHLYIQGSSYVNLSDEVAVKEILSNDFGFGYRYKYKLLSFYNIGFDISYHYKNFNLHQNEEKVVPNSITHDKEIISLNDLDLELYQRIQIGKTGNMIGFFVDMGAFVGWTFGSRHITKDEIPEDDPYNAGLRKMKHKDLDYTESLNYGLKGRIGYNNIAVCGSYRLADLFKASYNYPELPRLYVGIELGLH